MKNVLSNPMSNILDIKGDENKKYAISECFRIIHETDSPLASITKSFSATRLLLLRKENFGIKSPIILVEVPYGDVPNFIRKNCNNFPSPLIFGSDFEWFQKQKKEVFSFCLDDTIFVLNTMTENPGMYMADLDDLLYEIKGKSGSLTFMVYT